MRNQMLEIKKPVRFAKIITICKQIFENLVKERRKVSLSGTIAKLSALVVVHFRVLFRYFSIPGILQPSI